MYTNSIESEKNFRLALYQSHGSDMSDGECVEVCKCPKCKSGTVHTKCTHIAKGGRYYHSFCDSCNEQFVLSRISADIFFHKPFKLLNKLETPFGDIQVKINGQPVPFRCREETVDRIAIKIIDILLSSFREEDLVTCGFDNSSLEFFGSDEGNVTYSCRNDKMVLCLCTYEPDDYDSEKALHCFEIDHMDGNGVTYYISKDPSEFDEYYLYQSKVASVGIAWQEAKEEYKSESELDLALSCVIG